MKCTVSVEYTDGNATILTYTVSKKKPDCTFTDNSVILNNLSGATVVRYAKGYFTTDKEVKYAHGSKFIRPSEIADDTVLIDDLNGTYTFLVTYNDYSVNIITHTF